MAGPVIAAAKTPQQTQQQPTNTILPKKRANRPPVVLFISSPFVC
jgi:hypothetical protein